MCLYTSRVFQCSSVAEVADDRCFKYSRVAIIRTLTETWLAKSNNRNIFCYPSVKLELWITLFLFHKSFNQHIIVHLSLLPVFWNAVIRSSSAGFVLDWKIMYSHCGRDVRWTIIVISVSFVGYKNKCFLSPHADHLTSYMHSLCIFDLCESVAQRSDLLSASVLLNSCVVGRSLVWLQKQLSSAVTTARCGLDILLGPYVLHGVLRSDTSPPHYRPAGSLCTAHTLNFYALPKHFKCPRTVSWSKTQRLVRSSGSAGASLPLKGISRETRKTRFVAR